MHALPARRPEAACSGPEFSELLAPYEPWRAKAAYMDRSEGNWLSNLQGLDMKNYLPLDILTKVDRMSMAHSIETRVPLLDHKLVEFAATIPPEMNLRGGTTKYVLKQRDEREFSPTASLTGPSKALRFPWAIGFGASSELMSATCCWEKAAGAADSSIAAISRAWWPSTKGGGTWTCRLWTLISFELWARVFLDRGARGQACAAA